MKMPAQYRVWVDGENWDFERPILDSRQLGETVVVVFDHTSFPKNQQARNLMAFNLERELLWIAEHPTNQPTDAYLSISQDDPLVVSNLAGFECEIDLQTGKLLKSVAAKLRDAE
jgi:hypothetical protein